MTRAAILAVVAAGCLAAPAKALAEESRAPLPRRSFREACRTFFLDGGYLFTFPKRTTEEGVWLTAGFTAGTLLLIEQDDEIRSHVLDSDSEAADRLGHIFEPLGRAPVEAAALGIFYATGRLTRRQGMTSTAATAFEAYLWTFIITAAGKAIFGRESPQGPADAHGFFEGGTIFPSGHTSRSFAIASVLADRYGHKAAWIAYPAAGLIGLATLQQDTHWASDILAGAGLGLAIGNGIAHRHPAPAPEGAEAPQSAGAAAGRCDRAAGHRASWQLRPAAGGALLRVVF